MRLLSFASQRKERGEERLNPDKSEISISFVSPEEIRELNREYRGVDSVTDVLSFPMFDEGWDLPAEELMAEEGLMLGDVVICLERARQQAQEFGHSQEREIIYLFTHSILHLLGYDHMTDEDKREMRLREELVLGEMGITRENSMQEETL